MTGYGNAQSVAPLPDDTLFFDFNSPQGKSWSNTVGKMTVNNRNMTVRSGSKTYGSSIQITQTAADGGSFSYTFAPGVGFVRLDVAKMAFVLDESASHLPGDLRADSRNDSRSGVSRPVPHVPNPGSTPEPAHPAPPPPSAAAGNRTGGGRVAVGLMAATFPNEPESPENLMKRFQQTIDAGIGYIQGAGKWTDLEPKKGEYRFDGLNFQAEYAQKLHVPMSYTLRLIDTVNRIVPADLEKKSWNDPEMRNRVLRLIEGMAPHLKGRVQWFMFGNEIDGYFQRHPKEVADFAALYGVVKGRLKELVPGIQVSSTLMFGGIDTLDGLLKPLDQQYDFLSFTYYPINPDFSVQDPSVPQRDFDRMRGSARSRKIVLQEIGYPTSPLNKSSEDKQAQFVQNVFEALRANSDLISAGSFFILADLREQLARDLSSYYGVRGAPVFQAFLQTLGMFDGQGRPKKSWSVFQSEVRR
jgi:hypothetical protein